MDLGSIEGGIFIGEAEFLIGDMLKKKKEGLIKPLHNVDKRKMQPKLLALGTICTMRYE
jgi:hypothetical protein